MATLISNTTDKSVTYRPSFREKVDGYVRNGKIPAFGSVEISGLQLGDRLDFEDELGNTGNCTINSTSNSKYLAKFNIELAGMPINAKSRIAQRQNREETVYLANPNRSPLNIFNPLTMKMRKNINKHLPNELIGQITTGTLSLEKAATLPFPSIKREIAGIADKNEKPKPVEMITVSIIVIIFFIIFVIILAYLLYNRKTMEELGGSQSSLSGENKRSSEEDLLNILI